MLAGHLLREEELHDHEHREQEHDAENQRRQRVDESGPIVDAGFAAPAGERHVVSTCFHLTVLRNSSLRGSSPAMRSSNRFISRLCAACASAQSRIICCSVRMWLTRPWIASARLAIAAVAARFEPLSATASLSLSIALRISPDGAAAIMRPSWLSSVRSLTMVESQSSSSM